MTFSLSLPQNFGYAACENTWRRHSRHAFHGTPLTKKHAEKVLNASGLFAAAPEFIRMPDQKQGKSTRTRIHIYEAQNGERRLTGVLSLRVHADGHNSVSLALIDPDESAPPHAVLEFRHKNFRGALSTLASACKTQIQHRHIKATGLPYARLEPT